MYGAKGFLPFFSRKTFVVDGRGGIAMTHEGMPDVDRILTLLEGLRGDLPGA